MIKLGPTGKFPEGKLDDTDEGELTIAIGHLFGPNGEELIRIDFGKKISWMAMPEATARAMALAILEHCNAGPGTKEH